MTPPPKTPPSSICIVRLSALGDVVMVLPLIKMIRREWPEAKITWIIDQAVYPAVASIADANIEFIVIKKPRRISDYLALKRKLSGRVFDVLFCLQASWRANWIYPCIRANRKIGYGKDRAKDFHRFFVKETLPSAPPHIVDGFLQFAEKLGGIPNQSDYEGSWGISPNAEASIWAEKTLPSTPWLAVSPSASKAERNWQADGYSQAITHVWDKYKMPSVLLGGPSSLDRAMADEICKKTKSPVLDLTGKTNIEELIAALARCSVLLAPDTGAVHIARAFNRPVVGLYAVAPASRTGPYRQTSYCLDKFEEALALVHKQIDKISWSFRVHDPRAMQLIDIHSVNHSIDEAISSRELTSTTHGLLS